MATFKVGQRVKQVSGIRPEDQRGKVYEHGGIGDEGTIIKIDPRWDMQGADYAVLFDNHRSTFRATGAFAMFAYQLAPLTDPKADEFVESIKRLKVYEEPKVSTVTPAACKSEGK